MKKRSTAPSREGSGIVEAMIVLTLAGFLLSVITGLLVIARRSESRVSTDCDAVEEASRAWTVLERDVAGLHFVPGIHPLKARSGLLEMWIVDGAGSLHEVTYRFDPATGVLTRTFDGEPTRFSLGIGSIVRFVKVDPSYARGGGARLGTYGNRLLYRMTVRRGAQTLERSLTLVGEVPFRLKASRDTFPYWSREVGIPGTRLAM